MSQDTAQSFAIKVPCQIDGLDPVIPQLRRLCAGAGEVAKDQVLTAFNEAFVNVVKHSQMPAGELLEVQGERDGNKLVVRLIDSGVSFNLDPGAGLDVPPLSESGMGLFIIKSYMNEVTYEPAERNVLTMTRYLEQEEARR